MKKKYLFLSFIIPLACILLIFICNGVIWGPNSIFFSDSQYQYHQLLIYLKNIFNGLSNITYSFQIGFGSPMIATIAYYLASPFNLLVNLFNNIEFFYIFQVVFKISLCGLTMYLYLINQNNNKKALLFSTSYSLSLYIICNYYQIMWLDAYVLAPILLLGIDKLIQEGKYLLYGITLFLIILSNYYMGYMCCLFGVIYFIYKIILENKINKKIIKKFLIVSVLFGLMTMFIHIPNLLEIMNIDRVDLLNDLFNFNIIGILSNYYLGATCSNGINLYPYLYIGIFNIILLIIYFLNKKIDKKEKKISLIFISIMFVSVIFQPLNNFWHALSEPIGFNYRYIFLFNIFIISLCFKSFLNIENIEKKYYYLVLSIFLVLTLLILFKSYVNIWYLCINVCLFILYLLMFKINNKDIKILLCVLMIIELFFNGYIIIKEYNLGNRDYINGVYNEKVDSVNNIEDTDFYRMEFVNKFAFNDAINYGYYGVTGWLSSVDINAKFYDKIGYYSGLNMGFYNNSIVLDSLFGIKYYETLKNNKYYDLINTNKVSIATGFLYGISYTDSYLYQNPYALNLGYMISDNSKLEFNCDNGFECQNAMMNNMVGFENDVYKVEKIEDIIEIKDNKDFYVLIDDDDIHDDFNFCIGDLCEKITMISNRVIFVENEYNIGDKIKINVSDDHEINNIYMAYIDFDIFKENYEILNDNQLNITEFKEDYIKGNVEVNDNKVLFLSIAYDDNFNIKIDGKKIEYYKLFDNFIGIDLEEGYHEIEIKYEVKGFKLGIFVSIISFITFVIYCIYQKKKCN